MGPDVTIRGANQLAELSAAIRRTGNGGLRRELLRGIQQAGKPLKAAAQEAVLDNLPHGGGANTAVAANTKIGLRTRTSGSTPGVRVEARSGSRLNALNAGILRHPVYADGDKERKDWTWVNQPIPAGWWEKHMNATAPAVRTQILRSMDRVAQKVAHYG